MGDSCSTAPQQSVIRFHMFNLYNLKSVATQLFWKKEILYIVEIQDSYLPSDNFSQTQKKT